MSILSIIIKVLGLLIRIDNLRKKGDFTMSKKVFFHGVIVGIASTIITLIIVDAIYSFQATEFSEVNSNSYNEVLDQYVPEKAVVSAGSAKKIGLAYIEDIYGKNILTSATVEYDKDEGYWIISRDGFAFSDSLKVIVIDEKTGKIVSAIGYKN